MFKNLNYIKRLLLLAFTICPFWGNVIAQNLEEISLKKGLKMNGSVNLNTILYHVEGMEQRRDPFNMFLNGNLNLNLFGHNTPLSFSYSNTNKSFSQPYNQFSFSPQYKWIKTHIGHASMSFSPYTLSGHVFLGGGVELTPGKWRIAAMYGRLRMAVPFSSSDSLQNAQPSFKRMGYGLKVGYESKGDAISISIFSARDDINSLPFVPAESALTPEQNVALGFAARKKLLKGLFADFEYAISALNTNIYSNAADSIVLAPSNFLQGLLPNNSTSRYFDALRSGIGYQAGKYALQLRYERIAPGYKTLGAYYFNNDLENITIMPSLKLLKSKLSLSANVGIQKNNLDRSRTSTTKRTVMAFNASYLPNEKWNFTVSYSNFSTYTNIKPQQDPFFRDNLDNLDTLNFYQLSQTMNGSVIKSMGSKEKPQSIMLNVSYQQASDESAYDNANPKSDFINANVAYSLSWAETGTALTLATNMYTNNVGGTKTNYYGPTTGISHAFFKKKLRVSYSSTYNKTNSNGAESSPVWSNQMNLNYVPAGKDDKPSPHTLSVSIAILRKLKHVGAQPAFTETAGTINYAFKF